MKILIGGASGFIGKALQNRLKKSHQVYTLVRQAPSNSSEIFWDIDGLRIDTDLDFDAVINLTGENVGSGLWTKSKKEKILNSRVNATKTIARFFSLQSSQPKVVINASATGYYGSRGDETLTESSSKGSGFLSDVCDSWEKALLPLKDQGVRTVFLRTGVVLGKDGGLIKRLSLPFKLCLGGVLGDGSQVMSWIDLDDVVGAIDFILQNQALEGPVNLVSPNPVTNKDFTKTFAKVLHRPAIFPVPKSVIRFIFGEMGDEMILASQKVLPEKLLEKGYQFKYPTLESSLRRISAKV